MNPKSNKPKINKAEEPSMPYETSKIKLEGINSATFDFDAEFEIGYTAEDAKAESIRRIREWWGK
jgi:hypothetical protein